MEHFKGENGLSGLMGGKLASPSPARVRLSSSPGSALATPRYDACRCPRDIFYKLNEQ